ncbi:helix-turn-helix domain-containing protein [Neptunitalea lumnitzerae]|nr:helix-turn-helix domain-containing protein [Neptunitalea sp. Y10]
MSNSSDNEFFSDGITEEIINALTFVKGLKVIARTSSFAFKNKHIDVREIGTQLGVANVLEGSVRVVNNHVRITAQLISAVTGMHYWSKNFDRELKDIFKLQDEVSLLIANQIRENFGHLEIQDHLVKQSTRSFTAYELYLKGRYEQLQWTPDALLRAIEYYDKAILQDNQYARAYYGNMQCYGLLAIWGYMPKEIAMDKAITNMAMGKEIDTNLPEYTQAFVGKTFWGEWNFKAGYAFILETLALNPNYIDGLEAMAELCIALGFFEIAEEYAQKLLEVDPISANNRYTLAHIFYYQRNYESALDWVEKALEIRDDLELANHLKVLCLVQLKDEQQLLTFIANRPLEKYQKLLYQAVNGTLYVTEETLEDWGDSHMAPAQLAPYELYILANAGYKKEAFTLLKQYVQQKRGQLINYRQEPLLAPLHEFAEFSELHQSNLFLEDIIEKPKALVKPKVEDAVLEGLHQQLITYFEEEKPYLDTQLTLTSLGESIGMHPNRLSYLINEFLEVNFNEFVNAYRLTHFKAIAVLPENAHLTLLALAYDSGFNSKTVFNTYFKKAEGKTPKAWLKEQQ